MQYGYDNCSDGKGRLCSATTNDITTAYTYNPLGLIKTEVRTIDSTGYTTQYDYDRQGSITEITYPDSAEAKYTYNTAGLLEKVERKESGDASYTNVIDDIDYSPLEQISYQKAYNGVETTNTYDSSKLYRLSDKDTIKSTTKLQDLAYTYDDVGNITQIVDNSDTNTAKTANYTYDDLYRLTQAAITNVGYGSNYTRTYTYSAIGNITNKSDIGNYLYQGDQGTSKANPHAATSVNGVSYTYDNNGNLTSDSTWTHTWDYKNRLTQSSKTGTTVSYEYDHNGNRIKKVESNNTFYYINKYYEVDDNKLIKYYFANGVSVATVEVISDTRNNPSCKPPASGNWVISSDCTFTGFATAPADVEVNTNSVLTLDAGSLLEIDFDNQKLVVRSGSGVLIKKGATLAQTNTQPTFSITYHHTDHLSGNTVETDSSGNAIEVIDYFPFGDVRFDTGDYENKYKFTGKELDEATGLYNYGQRYYSGSIARFISQDAVYLSIGIKDLENKTSLKLENYLSNPQALNSGRTTDKLNSTSEFNWRKNTPLKNNLTFTLDEYPEKYYNWDKYLVNPQLQNSYSYAANNPLKYTDPKGEFPVLAAPLAIPAGKAFIAAAGAATVAVTGYIMSQNITWDPGRQILPNPFDSSSPDETKLFPNGQGPKMPFWKKATVIGSALAAGAKIVKDTYNEIKDSWNKAEQRIEHYREHQNGPVLRQDPSYRQETIRAAD